ncbi:DUF1640 domain-containing protein [Methylotetracoccus oryzae]|uniref:DUF1640 domain-containing protein n=1 Tax=Methylotetracoccus oryzae TaxID=1919059 RepID=UPI00111BB31D|nr:DUF1640 domain-containing protein [Methylotetracoccus oryzae]
MSVALRVYEQLTDAGEDKVRARAIADGFEQMEERYAPLRDTATQGQLRETELRLQKEIKEVELKLGNEIREVELKLTKEIEGVRLDVKALEARGEKNRADLVRWVVAVGMLQTTLVIGVLMKIAHLL